MRRLKDMTVHEISLVKRAANKRKFLITKNAEVSMPAPDLEKIRDSLLSVPEPILKAVDAVTKGTFAKDDGAMTLTDDQAARLKAAGRMLQPVIQDVPMDAITQMLSAIGATGTDALMDTALADGVDADDAEAAAAVDDAATDATEAASDAEADAAAATDAAAEAVDAAPAAAPEEDPRQAAMQRALAKSKEVYAQMLKDAGFDPDEEGEDVPPAEAKTMAKSDAKSPEAVSKSLQDANDELAKKHKEAVSKSISLQLKLDKQEVIAKAAELPHLGKSDEIVDLLLRAKQRDAEGFDEHFKVMKTWNDTIAKSGMFTEHGSVATDEGAGIESRIDRAVANIVAKSGNTTTEKAYTHFITNTPEGREMFREYMYGSSNNAKG